MDEQVLELLAKVVQQNAELIRQNGEFIEFIQKRDADVAELQRASLDNHREDREQREHVYRTLGIGRGDLVMINVLRDLGVYGAGRELIARLKAAGKIRDESP
jgi:hypothetical protein